MDCSLGGEDSEVSFSEKKGYKANISVVKAEERQND